MFDTLYTMNTEKGSMSEKFAAQGAHPDTKGDIQTGTITDYDVETGRSTTLNRGFTVDICR